MHRCASWVFAALLASTMVGCANHIRFVESTADISSQNVLERALGVQGHDGVLEDSEVHLEFFAQDVVETQRQMRVTKTEEFTPYSGGREFLELPAGIVSLPLSFAFNVVDVLLFGYIPNDVVYGYTHWTFAALNPALNTESSKRKKVRTVDEKTESTGSERETVRSTMAGYPVKVSLDGGPVQALQTDARGRVRVELLDLLDGSPRFAPRRLSVELVSRENGTVELSEPVYLDRRLAQRLFRVAPLLARASEGASAEDISNAVYALEQLGFRRRSAELQDETFARFRSDPDALDRFRARLDELFASGVDPAELSALPAGAED